jgi:uncharacterized LabA/DUF88 family protein
MPGKVALLVDIPSQFDVINKHHKGCRINYERYYKQITEGYMVVRALAYTTQIQTEAFGFIQALRRFGYDVKNNQATILDGKPSIAGTDRLMPIIFDACRLLTRVDSIIFGSNDIRLIPLIKHCQEEGVRVVIASVDIPAELIGACDDYIEIGGDIIEHRIQEQ